LLISHVSISKPLFAGHSLGSATSHASRSSASYSLSAAAGDSICSATSHSLSATTVHSVSATTCHSLATTVHAFHSLHPATNRNSVYSFTAVEHNDAFFISSSSCDDKESAASFEFWHPPEHS
jgi:hypothetical protein